jgi:hypothetical protein
VSYLGRATTNIGDYLNVVSRWDGDGEPDRVLLRRFIVQDMAQSLGVCPVIEAIHLEWVSDRQPGD